jgi:hypothetical protein
MKTTTPVIYSNPELESLRQLVAGARAQLAELETDYTKEKSRVDAVQAILFRRLGRGWVNVSPGLGNAIVGNMAEIYLNAFEHGQSQIGVFACGQHFPKNRELNLTIVDFGVGIPSNVRSFKASKFAPEALAAAHCMEWAFQSGTSTKQGDTFVPRGVGLDLLHGFVRQNGGRLEMFSHEGYALIADGKISFAERSKFFEGTLVNISLKCDEKYYCLASEIDNEPLF